jgi:hypothetical protein
MGKMRAGMVQWSSYGKCVQCMLDGNFGVAVEIRGGITFLLAWPNPALSTRECKIVLWVSLLVVHVLSEWVVKRFGRSRGVVMVMPLNVREA